MALASELPVYRDTMQLTKNIYILSSNFNKLYKYSLGEELNKTSLSLIKLLYEANSNVNKIIYLDKFLSNFELLKALLTLSLELNACGIKEQKHILILIEKIGRQINGWKKKMLNT